MNEAALGLSSTLIIVSLYDPICVFVRRQFAWTTTSSLYRPIWKFALKIGIHLHNYVLLYYVNATDTCNYVRIILKWNVFETHD